MQRCSPGDAREPNLTSGTNSASRSSAYSKSLGKRPHASQRDVRGDYPEVPWRDVVGMRNRLIHAYDRVDLDLVWDVVTVELSGVIEALRVALQAELSRADDQ